MSASSRADDGVASSAVPGGALLGVEVVAPQSMVSAVSRDGSLYALDADGLLLRWEAGRPMAWSRADGARALAFSGEAVVAVAPTKVLRFDGTTLERLASEPHDGWVRCRGAAAAWTWSESPAQVFHHSAEGVVRLEGGAVPDGEAACTVNARGAALSWFDGLDAHVRTTADEHLSSSWWADAVPRGLADGSGWRVSTVEEATRLGVGACDVVEGAAAAVGCGDPTPAQVETVLRRGTRRAVAAFAEAGVVVVADTSGWVALFVAGGEPAALRFPATRVYGVLGESPGAVLACMQDAAGARAVALDPLRGTEITSIAVPVCPTAGRVTPRGGVLEQANGGPLLYDPQARRFGHASEGDGGAPVFTTVSRWHPPCGGRATEVVRTFAGVQTRVAGPRCGDVRVVDLVAGDATAGAAVCAANEPAALYGLSGAFLRFDPSIDCMRSPARIDEPGAAAGHATLFEGGGYRIDGSNGRYRVTTPTGSFDIQVAHDVVAAYGSDWLWASESGWDRVVWSVGDASPARSVYDRATQPLWRPDRLAELLGHATPADSGARPRR